MVDIHSHILPCVDDGSGSTQESVQLLNMLALQGIKTVVATPHFYANHQTVSQFIEKRNTAYENLKEAACDNVPEIILGAEVRYYEGISRMEDLSRLCIEGTSLLLIEMPTERWSEYTLKELISLSCSGFRVILAHIERYIRLQREETILSLLENDILTQVNASFFLNLTTRSKAIKMLKNGYIHLLGSDCHNVLSRPPYIGEALQIIEKKTGKDFLDHMINYSNALLRNSN